MPRKRKTDYQSVIDRLGLSQGEAAKVLNVDPRTSRRWALGEGPPPPVVMTLLRLIEATPNSLAAAQAFAKKHKTKTPAKSAA